MPPSTRRTQAKRPGDLTGVRGQQLASARDAEQAEAKAQIKDALEAERLAKVTEEVDYTSEAREKARKAAESTVVEGEVEVKPKTKRIRVNFPIEDMTFGREVISKGEFSETGEMIKPPVLGSLRTMSFEEGRWYTVDYDVYEHLLFLGYVYGD